MDFKPDPETSYPPTASQARSQPASPLLYEASDYYVPASPLASTSGHSSPSSATTRPDLDLNLSAFQPSVLNNSEGPSNLYARYLSDFSTYNAGTLETSGTGFIPASWQQQYSSNVTAGRYVSPAPMFSTSTNTTPLSTPNGSRVPSPSEYGALSQSSTPSTPNRYTPPSSSHSSSRRNSAITSSTLSRPASSLPPSKPFKCPKPNCNKSYKQANGLKYHMTHGTCNFVPPKDLEQIKDLLEQSRRDLEKLNGVADDSLTLTMSNISEAELQEVKLEAEKAMRPFACGVGDCQRRYKNMNGLRYHYQHSGDHGAVGLDLLASGQHECLQGQKRNQNHFTPLNDFELKRRQSVDIAESNRLASLGSLVANTSESKFRGVEKEAEIAYACGIGDCQRRYKNLNGLRYHYQHSDHGAVGLALLASGQHECLQGQKWNHFTPLQQLEQKRHDYEKLYGAADDPWSEARSRSQSLSSIGETNVGARLGHHAAVGPAPLTTHPDYPRHLHFGSSRIAPAGVDAPSSSFVSDDMLFELDLGTPSAPQRPFASRGIPPPVNVSNTTPLSVYQAYALPDGQKSQPPLPPFTEPDWLPGPTVLAPMQYSLSSSPPTQCDLPSDPNLYKAYLCRAFNIPIGDVIDLTGYICRGRFIAAGGSGEVWDASWIDLSKNPLERTAKVLPKVVIKLLKLPPLRNEVSKDKRYKKMKRELLLWSRLNHLHVLPLIGIARIEGDANLPALISPWMENGNVMEFLKENPSFPVSGILKDTIKGLHYLHTFNPTIVHGDVKGANVLINHRKEACLSDFDLSRFVVDNTLWRTTATHANGTLRWMAPELIEGDMITPTIATDIYAFAMTCYEIISRQSPFAAANDPTVIRKVIAGDRPARVESCHSDKIWYIISRCWAHKPEDRPTTEETLELILLHDNTPANL